MTHRIFTGPFAALEPRWMQEVAHLQEGDPLSPAAVLLGSNILAAHLRRRIAESGRAAANLHFYTFLDLATRMAGPPGVASRKPRLPRLGASIILESVLAERTPDVFAPVSAFSGFRDALLDTFRDLRDAGLSPEVLDRSMRRWLGSVPDRKPFLEGLSDLYRRFRGKVQLFHDVDDDFRAAAENPGGARQALGCRCLLVYGIYDTTGQQEDLLESLKQVLEMVYFVPFVNDEVSGFARGFVERLERALGVTRESLAALYQDIGRVSDPAPGRKPGLRPDRQTASLCRLHNADFGLSEKSGPGGQRGSKDGQMTAADESCVLVSAPGASREATEVAREVLRAVRDGVIQGFHEAAVILRQPQEDLPVLTEAFRLRRIPYFVDGGSRFSQRPLCKAVMAVCGLQKASFSRQAVLIAMELVSASLPHDPAAGWDVPEWRALTNDARFLAGIESWDAGTKSLVQEVSQNLRRTEAGTSDDEAAKNLSIATLRAKLEAAKTLRKAWLALQSAAGDWPESLSWRDWTVLLEQRLEPLLGNSSDWPAFHTVLDELGNLEQMARTDGLDPGVLRTTMTAALSESLSAHSHPEGRFQRRGVNLLSISAARGLRFPLVIVPGLDEGRFPARLRQDPLLLDPERARMGRRVPRKSQRMEEEKLLFDMAARSATRRLVLLTSRLDEASDRERIPSQFFLRVAAAMRGCAVGLRDFTEGSIPGFRSVGLENPAPAEGQVAVDDGEIRLRLITANRASAQAALQALAAVEPDLLEGPLAYDRARWIKRLTEFDGCLADRRVIKWIGGKAGPSAGPVSASHLEDYARCPYRFYLKRVVELQGWTEQEPARQMDPLERGQTIHTILEKFLLGMAAEIFVSTSVQELWGVLQPQAFVALEQVRPVGIPDLLWEIERERLIAMLQSWLQFEKARAQQGYLPAYFERTFGEFQGEEGRPSPRIRAGCYTFDLRGRIDRIDLTRDGRSARVIDYKTGPLPDSMKKNATPLMSGERIQIAVYAAAVLSEFSDLESVVGEYLHLQPRDGGIVPCSFNDAALREAIGRLPGILEIVGEGISSGVFFDRARGAVRPAGHCDYCEYLPICGKDRVRRQERKAGDAAVVRFLQMQQPYSAAEDEQ